MTWTAPSKGGYSAKRGRKQGEPFPKTPEAFTAPASDTRREDVAREAEIEREALRQFPDAPYMDDRDQVRLGFEAGAGWAFTRLAVLPAPPVVDEAKVRAEAAKKAEKRHPSWHDNGAGIVQGSHWRAGYVEGYTAARLRGATRG